MNEHEIKRLDPAKGAHTDIIDQPGTQGRNKGFEFIKDFLTGFGALILFLCVFFIGIPLMMLALKIGVVFAIPLLYVGAFIILIALLGRLIRILFLKK
jgi:hypothetical protein